MQFQLNSISLLLPAQDFDTEKVLLSLISCQLQLFLFSPVYNLFRKICLELIRHLHFEKRLQHLQNHIFQLYYKVAL